MLPPPVNDATFHEDVINGPISNILCLSVAENPHFEMLLKTPSGVRIGDDVSGTVRAT